MSAELNGTIARLIGAKGFGFIKGKDGVEYFFHRQDFAGDFEDLVYRSETGEKISLIFSSVPSQKGPRAANVRLID